MSSRRRISPTAGTPTQPGRIADEPTTPSSWRIGPGSPMPAPITWLRVDAGLGQQFHHQVGGGVEPFLGGVIRVERDARSARIREERSEIATRRWL